MDKRGIIAKCIDQIKQLGCKDAKAAKDAKTVAAVEECPICCERKPRAQMLALRTCSHRICHDCLRSYAKVQIEANKVPIVCPQKCSKHLDLDQCRPHLSAKLAELFEARLIEARVPESQRVYCPFPECSALMVLSKDGKTLRSSRTGSSDSLRVAFCSSLDSSAKCMECSRLFCVECRVPWHASMNCAAYQSQEYNREDAELHRLAKAQKWRRCQKCKRMVELWKGCYHIYCRCGHQFCYLCGAEWRNEKQTCKCRLWDVENIIYALQALADQ